MIWLVEAELTIEVHTFMWKIRIILLRASGLKRGMMWGSRYPICYLQMILSFFVMQARKTWST